MNDNKQLNCWRKVDGIVTIRTEFLNNIANFGLYLAGNILHLCYRDKPETIAVYRENHMKHIYCTYSVDRMQSVTVLNHVVRVENSSALND